MVCWSAGLAARRDESSQMASLLVPAVVRFDQMLRRFARMAGGSPISKNGDASTDRAIADVPAVWRHDDRMPG